MTISSLPPARRLWDDRNWIGSQNSLWQIGAECGAHSAFVARDTIAKSIGIISLTSDYLYNHRQATWLTCSNAPTQKLRLSNTAFSGTPNLSHNIATLYNHELI